MMLHPCGNCAPFLLSVCRLLGLFDCWGLSNMSFFLLVYLLWVRLYIIGKVYDPVLDDSQDRNIGNFSCFASNLMDSFRKLCLILSFYYKDSLWIFFWGDMSCSRIILCRCLVPGIRASNMANFHKTECPCNTKFPYFLMMYYWVITPSMNKWMVDG